MIRVSLAVILASLLSACFPADELDIPRSVPLALQGRWGLVAADCDPRRDDAKGVMVVQADTLAFYESRATLARVDDRSETRLEGMFVFSGEGETWQRALLLDLRDGGEGLMRQELGEGAAPDALHYMRCPAP
ncbi:hypothetical protein JYP51_10820 [Ponticoccus gilvus]|nr:hypothetical protein [Enemella evansiae]